MLYLFLKAIPQNCGLRLQQLIIKMPVPVHSESCITKTSACWLTQTYFLSSLIRSQDVHHRAKLTFSLMKTSIFYWSKDIIHLRAWKNKINKKKKQNWKHSRHHSVTVITSKGNWAAVSLLIITYWLNT